MKNQYNPELEHRTETSTEARREIQFDVVEITTCNGMNLSFMRYQPFLPEFSQIPDKYISDAKLEGIIWPEIFKES